MHIKKENLKNIYLFLVYFFAFGGYYAALMTFSNVIGGAGSRNFTIPIRFGIVLLLSFIFMMQPKIKIQKGLVYFALFSLAYLLRIFIEYIDKSSLFHITELEFFLYFISFVLFPLFLLSQFSLNEKNYENILWGLLIGVLVLSVFTVIFYKNLIGNVARISLAVAKGEEYISPLALSYSSALGIGVGLSYLLTNKVRLFKKIAILAVVGLSFIPFFLGSSRGAIFALSFPFVFYFLYVEGMKRRVVVLVSIILLTVVFGFLTEYMGSGVFERLAGTYSAIETGGSGAARIEIWRAGLIQFIENPLFGNSLNCTYVNHHPHNILIEVMITTGIVGLVPFVLFLYQIFKKMKDIVKFFPGCFWVCVIFIQAFMQNMFSGGIYAAGWFAVGGGLVFAMKLNNRM